MERFDKKGEIEVISHRKFLRAICAEKFLSIQASWASCWKIFKPYWEKMEATRNKEKKYLDMLIWGVEWKTLDFKLPPGVT